MIWLRELKHMFYSFAGNFSNLLIPHPNQITIAPPPPSQHHPLGGIHFIDPANRENKDREEIKVINWAYVNAASLGWKLKSGAIRCSQRVMRPCAQISHRYAQLHIPLCSLFLSQYWSNLRGYYTAFSQTSIISVHTDNDAAHHASKFQNRVENFVFKPGCDCFLF